MAVSRLRIPNVLKKLPIPGLRAGDAAEDPDEHWSNLHREREKNAIYKWANLKSGGELLRIFDYSGEDGVLAFAHEKLVPLLYNDGEKPEKIKLNDFMKFKNDQKINLAGNDDKSDREDIAKFEEHQAQWRLNRRGIEGETVIHLLYARGDPRAAEVARILIRKFHGLALDVFEGSLKYGQSALHLAILNKDYDSVNFLLHQGASVTQRARGKFFLPEDQKQKKPKSQTDYVGYAYYGEYPLAFAVTMGNKDIYDVLIQFGADPNRQDSFGNTVLHICVINNSIEMYSYAVRHFAKPANVNILNGGGYTPLTLAAKMGRKHIFDEMLELMKVEFWRCSDVACSAYPLTALDTIKPDGSTNWDSALMIMINGNTEDHLDMIGGEIVQRLLQDKWRLYARGKLFQRLGLLILHLALLAVIVYLRPTDQYQEEDARQKLSKSDYEHYFRDPRHLKHNDYYTTPQFITKSVCEVLLVLNCLVTLFYFQAVEIRSTGLRGWLRNLKGAPTRIFFLVANVLILLCVPCRLVTIFCASNPTQCKSYWHDARYVEDAFLTIAVPCSWFYLLFFARSTMITGPFVQMMYTMIEGDVLRFLIIAAICLLAFVPIFSFLGARSRNDPRCVEYENAKKLNVDVKNYEDIWQTLATFMRDVTIESDSVEMNSFECFYLPILTKLFFVFYRLIMSVLIISMLIAMMGNTYAEVIPHAAKAWRRNWAQIIVVLERSLNPGALMRAQQDYSIKLTDSLNDELEVRAVLVVKQTKKTRAGQQKQAIANWKRLGRKIIAKIHSFGVDRTKFIMHNASRAGTPMLMDAVLHDSDTIQINRVLHVFRQLGQAGQDRDFGVHDGVVPVGNAPLNVAPVPQGPVLARRPADETPPPEDPKPTPQSRAPSVTAVESFVENLSTASSSSSFAVPASGAGNNHPQPIGGIGGKKWSHVLSEAKPEDAHEMVEVVNGNFDRGNNGSLRLTQLGAAKSAVLPNVPDEKDGQSSRKNSQSNAGKMAGNAKIRHRKK